jgi:hypothetical protein
MSNNPLSRFFGWFFHRSRGDSPFKTLMIHATLIVACIIAVYPVLRVVTISLRPNDTLLTTDLRIIPENATLDNYKEVLESEDPTSDELKKLVSKMSFDHGGSWQDLQGPSKDVSGKDYACVSGKCNLHLHSVTHPHNLGKVFSSTSAPGLVLGVGSIGSQLSPYESCDTFLSTDAGQSWRNIAKGPYKYESADAGSLLVLVPDTAQPQHTILYSYDWGTTWKTRELQLDTKSWIPYFTMLDPDSTFQIVLMFALDPDNRSEGWMVQIDFSQAQMRRCDFDASHPEQSKDFELWSPVGASSSKCLLGQTVSYYRRKPTADCSVGQDFALPQMVSKPCVCSLADYTCDTKYRKVSSGGSDFTCEADEEGEDQPRDCPIGTNYRGKSGFRKVSGNQCEGGLDKPEWVEKPCRVKKNSPDSKNPADGSKHSSDSEPTSSVFVPDSQIAQLVYVANSSVVFLRSEMGQVYKSFDEGKVWKKISELDSHGFVNGIEKSQAKPSRILFITASAVYFMDDAIDSDKIEQLSVPQEPNDFGAPVIDFHPTEADWYIFTGGLKSCNGTVCHSVTYMTKNNGKEWKEIDSWSRKCTWARRSELVSLESDDIYCHTYMYKSGEISQDKLDGITDKSKNPEQFILINNHGTGQVVMKDKGVFGFYTISNLLVVAAKEKENASKLFVSSDGLALSEAQFPPQVLLKENSFTLLPATKNGLFLDVSVADSDMVGSLFKSNQDGRFLSQSLAATHRDTQGRIDFDRVQDIDGILFANTYDNPTDPPSSRRIRSVLSFDDGASWNYIKAPKKDSEDKETCSSATEVILFPVTCSFYELIF